MTAPALPAAPARVGVAAGWWVTSIRSAAQTGHRLEMSALSGRRSHRTLCGRTLTRPRELRGDIGRMVDLCRDCRTKAARCPDPAVPVTHGHAVPAPTARRRLVEHGVLARTAPEENTVAARVGRRRAFRQHVVLDEAAAEYLRQPHGVDAAADAADDEGGASAAR